MSLWVWGAVSLPCGVGDLIVENRWDRIWNRCGPGLLSWNQKYFPLKLIFQLVIVLLLVQSLSCNHYICFCEFPWGPSHLLSYKQPSEKWTAEIELAIKIGGCMETSCIGFSSQFLTNLQIVWYLMALGIIYIYCNRENTLFLSNFCHNHVGKLRI